MIAVFWYTDGSIVEREFKTHDECRFFAHSEGDHLDYWEIIQEEEWDD